MMKRARKSGLPDLRIAMPDRAASVRLSASERALQSRQAQMIARIKTLVKCEALADNWRRDSEE